jgi:hypothetical protein
MVNKLIIYSNLKSWQIFLLLFLSGIVEGLIPLTDNDLMHLVLQCCAVIIYMHWVYSTAKQLNNRASSIIKLSWRFFKVNYVCTLIWIFFIFILPEPKNNVFDTFGSLIIPFHLYASFCVFYMLWFMSKSLTSLEANKETANKEILITLFLFGFLPIGIWWLQPRIRVILAV